MTNKLYSISVYDYVNMLCKEIGATWNTDTFNNIYITKKDLYKASSNNIDIAKSKRKK